VAFLLLSKELVFFQLLFRSFFFQRRFAISFSEARKRKPTILRRGFLAVKGLEIGKLLARHRGFLPIGRGRVGMRLESFYLINKGQKCHGWEVRDRGSRLALTCLKKGKSP